MGSALIRFSLLFRCTTQVIELQRSLAIQMFQNFPVSWALLESFPFIKKIYKLKMEVMHISVNSVVTRTRVFVYLDLLENSNASQKWHSTWKVSPCSFKVRLRGQ